MKHERRKIALAQMANAGSVEKSLQKSLALLREAAENGADGAVLSVQKMVHVAQAPQFCEQDYYTPSDDGFHVFDTPSDESASWSASTATTPRAFARKRCAATAASAPHRL